MRTKTKGTPNVIVRMDDALYQSILDCIAERNRRSTKKALTVSDFVRDAVRYRVQTFYRTARKHRQTLSV